MGHLCADVVVFRGLAHSRKLGIERGDDLVGHAYRRLSTRKFLKGRPNRVDLGQPLRVEFAHPRAFVRLARNEMHALKISQCLAHGRLAGSELAGELTFDNPRTGRVCAIKDARHHTLLNLLAQHRAYNRGLQRRITPGHLMVLKRISGTGRHVSRLTTLSDKAAEHLHRPRTIEDR